MKYAIVTTTYNDETGIEKVYRKYIDADTYR